MNTNTCETMFWSFLRSREAASTQHALEDLLQKHLMPGIEAFLRTKFQFFRSKSDEQDREELQQEILFSVIAALHRLRACPTADRISNWNAYMRQIARSTFSRYLETRYPQRFRLQNKLRYMVKTTPNLALWSDETHEWCVGLKPWYGTPRAGETDQKRRELLDHPNDVCRQILPQADIKTYDPRQLITVLLQWSEQPLALDDLVGAYAAIQDLQDLQPVSLNADCLQCASTVGKGKRSVEDREGQLRLWQAIRKLHARTCAALLLHSHDTNGNSVLDLLLLDQIASQEEIAEAMEMPVEQLAALWNELPLDDARIAPLLGVKPNRIAQLRMTARRQLEEALHTTSAGESSSTAFSPS